MINNTPEFLNNFSDMGDYLLKVKFKDKHKSIIHKYINLDEINKLISLENKEFYNEMYFDGYLLSIENIEINIKKKEIVIKTI